MNSTMLRIDMAMSSSGRVMPSLVAANAAKGVSALDYVPDHGVGAAE